MSGLRAVLLESYLVPRPWPRAPCRLVPASQPCIWFPNRDRQPEVGRSPPTPPLPQSQPSGFFCAGVATSWGRTRVSSTLRHPWVDPRLCERGLLLATSFEHLCWDCSVPMPLCSGASPTKPHWPGARTARTGEEQGLKVSAVGSFLVG